jgi:hypothetical protein
MRNLVNKNRVAEHASETRKPPPGNAVAPWPSFPGEIAHFPIPQKVRSPWQKATFLQRGLLFYLPSLRSPHNARESQLWPENLHEKPAASFIACSLENNGLAI